MTAIGIDLGTTYSCVAVLRNGRIEIVPNDEGDRLTPSCVSFSDTEILTGKAAKDEIPFNFENTLFQIKRLIGRKYDDPNVQQDSEYWGFKIINEDNKPKIQVNYKHEIKTYYPEEISALILRQLKDSAEAYMGCKFTDAVITVPAYFNDSQRKATKEAGRIAGLNVLQMINEPTAAAIAYGLDREKKDERHVLIFDLGGGTFDVTLITIKDRVFDVKATGGDTHLGGEDFDGSMVKHFVEEFNKKNKVDISNNKRAMSRLRIQCEAAKRKLSVSVTAKVQVDGFHDGKDYESTISRATFEELNKDYFERILQALDTILSDAKFSKEKVDEVVLVGGSTRIPKLRNMIQEYFNGKELYKTINPDEAVAFGAAALAADLSIDKSSKIKEFILHDIVPLPLGIKVVGDIMSVVVDKNSKIPSKHYKSVTTVADNQTTIRFSIYQGEKTSTMHNRHLGSFVLTGISPAPRQVPIIDVCFDIDSSGILTVTAKDKITGNKNNLQLEAAELKLSVDEIDRMVASQNELQLISESKQKLEKSLGEIVQAVSDPKYADNLSNAEKETINDYCVNAYAFLDESNPGQKELDEIRKTLEQNCKLIFVRIDNKAKILEHQKKKEAEEYSLRQEAQNNLKRLIDDVESKVQRLCFKTFTNDKLAILQSCQKLRNWMEENKNAAINDIYDHSKNFREWSEEMFEKMEEAVKVASQNELQLISESKQKLEKCLDEVVQAVSDPKYADNLSNAEKETINNYCTNAYALLDESNPSQKELDEKRKSLEQNCKSIFVRIDDKNDEEESIEVVVNEAKEKSDAINKLEELVFKINQLVELNSETISPRERKGLLAKSKEVLEFAKSNENADSESIRQKTSELENYYNKVREYSEYLKSPQGLLTVLTDERKTGYIPSTHFS